MIDYKKMYAILCGAVDEVIEPLEQIPMARSAAGILREALLQAEDVYIDSSTYSKDQEELRLLELDGGAAEIASTP